MNFFVGAGRSYVGSAFGSVETELLSRIRFVDLVQSASCSVGTVLLSSRSPIGQNSQSALIHPVALTELKHSTTERHVKLKKVLEELSVSYIDISEAHKRSLIFLISE